MNNPTCPALFISAPASGQGKTTVTALLAFHYRKLGLKVRVFKTGPDYIDPQILQQASGHVVYQLDLWMVGEEQCRLLLNQAAQQADIILIEGVMGLFDGSPSSADLAEMFGIPILVVIDAGAMAQTFGALVQGLQNYRPALPFAGAIANRVASSGHAEMLQESIPSSVEHFGYLMKNSELELPERHLGLLLANEIENLESRLEAGLQQLHLPSLDKLPKAIPFPPVEGIAIETSLAGQRIGIAQDNAFAFIYPANLDLLKKMGAELCFFSPLTDSVLPEIDSLWLPGGYPELHLDQLSNNKPMLQAIREHHKAGKPIIAECGGMLYLQESLTDQAGKQAKMLGILAGQGIMQKKLAGLGMQQLTLGNESLRGHTFHYSRIEGSTTNNLQAEKQRDGKPGEAVYIQNKLYASYLHLYFPSSPTLVSELFRGNHIENSGEIIQ